MGKPIMWDSEGKRAEEELGLIPECMEQVERKCARLIYFYSPVFHQHRTTKRC